MNSLSAAILGLILFAVSTQSAASSEPFRFRGYYMTFMRMPTFDLPAWKEMVDDIEADGGNTLLLWLGGGFRSKKFPVTWQYNRGLQNVARDFVRDLIDYAHTKDVKVLLCLTPFAYDGVNQYPLEHPELTATQKNGQPAQFWGMHSWGYNLCPSKAESQRFMFEYAREMLFDFYPNADGLMIESSDYAICHCSECREKFFEKEFQFVRRISDDLWREKPNAMILVYPHYFSGRKVTGFEVTGAKQSFDPRWTLFFTPHSAHIDTNLLRVAKTSILWTEGLTLGTPSKIRDGARMARQHGIAGFVPSLEPFSCVDGPPGSGKPRQKPFHFEWLRDGQVPLNELLIRVNRIAYREFTRDPDLGNAEFKKRLGQELLSGGDSWQHSPADATKPQAATGAADDQVIDDLLYLQESYFLEADWFRPSPLLEPKRLLQRAEKEKWSTDRMDRYTRRVEHLRALGERYRGATKSAEREMHRIASLLVEKWNAAGRQELE